MEPILFNIFRRNSRGHTKAPNLTVEVAQIQQIDLPRMKGWAKDDLYAIQPFATGWRVDNNSLDYSTWNGTIFIDIDSKKFKHKFNFEVFKQGIESALSYIYSDNYYAMQTSASGNSLHIIMYYDCKRTQENWRKCAAYTFDAIRNIAHELGTDFERILSTPDVIDDCTRSMVQIMYMSSNPISYGNYRSPNFGRIDIDALPTVLDDVTKTEVKFNNARTYKVKDTLTSLNDWSYSTRWGLCWILFNYFNFDHDKCLSVYSTVLPQILEHRQDYTREQLIRQFERDIVTGKGKNYSYKTSLLEWCEKNWNIKFSLKKEFIPQDIKLYKADAIYELADDETLSSIHIDWSRDKINHLFAGCGFGKTFMGKMFGNSIAEDAKCSDFSSFIFRNYSNLFNTKGVCFISPMKSINKDAFAGMDDWLIVDSDNKESNKEMYDTISNAIKQSVNICTTWESFVILEMWKLPFEYVILDEVHSWYMYDYRVKSISRIKDYLQLARGIKIVMTGTPSYEVMEMDMYKIQVNKSIHKVNADIVLYQKSPKGYIFNDIVDWIKEENHYALIFRDRTNYRDAEVIQTFYGIDCDVFNSNYRETVDYVLTNHEVKKQVTLFSVYGQAGINIILPEGVKARIYILCDTGLGIIQYANRIRNKEAIDKIVIPYKMENVNNRYNEMMKVRIDDYVEEAEKRLEALNSTIKDVDIFSMQQKDIMRLLYGFNQDVLLKMDGKYIINWKYYETWLQIKMVTDYEKQLQVIYNRLKQNYFEPNIISLEKDVKQKQRTNLRSTQFGGMMARFDNDLVKENKDGHIWLDVDDEFRKICTGDLIDMIENVLNFYHDAPYSLPFDECVDKFKEFIRSCISSKGSIKKSYIKMLRDMLYYSKYFDQMYNNAFLTCMLSDDWDEFTITAAYMRTKYNDKLSNVDDLNALSSEAFKKIRELRLMVREYADVFSKFTPTPIEVENDAVTEYVYKYLKRRYGAEITIDGVTYKNITEASKATGLSRKTIYKKLNKSS